MAWMQSWKSFSIAMRAVFSISPRSSVFTPLVDASSAFGFSFARGRSAGGAVAVHRGAGESLGALVQQADGIALRILHDFAAGGVGCVFRDAGGGQGGLIDERGVAAGVGEENGVIGCG